MLITWRVYCSQWPFSAAVKRGFTLFNYFLVILRFEQLLNHLEMKGNLRQLLTLTLVFFAVVFAQAQVKTYSGVVVSSEDGQTMPGVSIKVSGTSRGTSADFDGNFVISAEKGQTLEFSFVGYKTKAVKLGDAAQLTVTLDPDAAMLDDVVVVAYGTAKKKDLTGSISTINAGEIKNRQVSSVTRALDGQVAGIQVTSASGQPGSDATIRIRGIGSMNASNDALILLDGVPYPSTLSTINPEDIESVTVLKDAASTSLYGSRAANGIVAITTKRGKSGQKAQVSLNVRMGFNENGVPSYDYITDMKTYYETAWLGLKGYYFANGNPWDHPQIGLAVNQNLFPMLGYMSFAIPGKPNATLSDLIDPNTGKMVDGAQLLYQDSWAAELYDRNFRQEYNVSVTGGSDKTNYYLSLGYLSDPSYVVNSSFERFSSRLNLDSQVNNWLKVGGNMSFVHRISNAPSNYGGALNTLNIFTFAKMYSSIYPVYARNADGSIRYDANGNKMLDFGDSASPNFGDGSDPNVNGSAPNIAQGTGLMSNTNPLSYMTKDKFRNIFDNFSGNAYAEARFLQDFTARATFSADMVFGNYNSFQNNQEGIGAQPDINGQKIQEKSTRMVLNANQTVGWAHDYGDHHVDALVGHEFYYHKYDYTGVVMKNMLVPGMDQFNNFLEIVQNPMGYVDATSLESYFARANYNYKNKYYASASVRRDGTSKFRYNKWGTFWSAGGAWRIAEEDFIRNSAPWINELKLRASVGTTGNQAVNKTDYPYTDLYEIGESGGQFTVTQVWWGNPNIRWEDNLQYDLGVDFRFWDRFYGSVDVYRRITRNLLYEVAQPASTGMGTVMSNDGKLANQGIEIDLNYDIFNNRNVFWSVNLNGSSYQQKILELPDYLTEALNGDGYINGAYLWKKGKDQYNLYQRRYAGPDPETGTMLSWKDVYDNNGEIIGREKTANGDEATKYEVGSAIPDFMGGFNTTVRYAGFDLTINTAFQIGGLVQDSEYGNLTWGGAILGRNLHKDLVGNTWTPDNPDAKWPLLFYGDEYLGTYERDFIDASYFSLKNVTLGYTLPEAATRKIGINSLRVFASGENLWLVSRRQGLDPRQSITGGTGYPAYSQMRSVSFGVNINF